jgi:hypothetical protein
MQIFKRTTIILMHFAFLILAITGIFRYSLNNDIIVAYELYGMDFPPERGFPFQM